MTKIIADFHLHTVSSGHAYSTIVEYAMQAKKVGLKYIAMTDHGPAMPGAPHYYHFTNLKMIPETIGGVRILRGAEVNIVDNKGNFDLHDDILQELEFVLFTFHPRCGYENQSIEMNTNAMINAMKNPYVTAIAHAENPQFRVDYEKIVRAAKDHNILIEVNNSSYMSRPGSRNLSIELLKAVKKHDAMVCLGSDSHFYDMIGIFDYALELIKEVGIKKENIINTSEKLIKEYVK